MKPLFARQVVLTAMLAFPGATPAAQEVGTRVTVTAAPTFVHFADFGRN